MKNRASPIHQYLEAKRHAVLSSHSWLVFTYLLTSFAGLIGLFLGNSFGINISVFIISVGFSLVLTAIFYVKWFNQRVSSLNLARFSVLIERVDAQALRPGLVKLNESSTNGDLIHRCREINKRSKLISLERENYRTAFVESY